MNARKHSPIRPPAPTREQIAALAHAIWEDRGCPEGSDLDHWLEAERLLQTGVRTPRPSRFKDHIPARPGDPSHDPALDGELEQELDEIVSRREPRSPTAL